MNMKRKIRILSSVFFGIFLFANNMLGLAVLGFEDKELSEITACFEKKLAVSQTVTLFRQTKNKKTAEYADEIELNSNSYNLMHGLAKDRVNLCACTSAKDGYKSHVLAGAVCVYANQNKQKTEHKLFTTALKFPFSPSKPKMTVDWTSNQSKIENSNDFYRRRSTAINGHSEPQFIDDIEALFKKDAPSLVKYFSPSKGDREVVMSGIELYGSFDMCDNCLESISEFRKKHQKGQMSIFQAVQDFAGEIQQNAFPVIYHSRYPYREATYFAEDDSYSYELDYLYKFTPSRSDIFKSSDCEEGYVLSQAQKVGLHKNKVYAHIHQFSRKKANYSIDEKSFLF